MGSNSSSVANIPAPPAETDNCFRMGCPKRSPTLPAHRGKCTADAPTTPTPPRCRRPGCPRPAYQGQLGNFCGKTCQRAGPPDQPCTEEPDPLDDGRSGKPFEAFHGTSLAVAQAIQKEGFTASKRGCLGAGIYLSGKQKAIRFAKERGAANPALLRCRVTVQKPKYIVGDGDGWQAAHDGCRTERTSLSARPEWCIKSPNQIQVLEVITLPQGS